MKRKVKYVIRELFGEQLEILAPLFEKQGVVISFPHLAMAKVAFDGDNIMGYHIFQLVPHIEPLWVAEEYRGGEVTHALVDEMNDFAKEAAGQFVCVSTSTFSDKLCREIHMDTVPGTVFIGRA